MDEFGFLKDLKKHFNFDLIGDDCAVLPFSVEHDLLATADLLVEGTDFDLAWASPAEIGHKSLAVSLSDVAAMGGEPLWAMFSVAIPERLAEDAFLLEFFAGINDLACEYGVKVAGGDISSGTDLLTVDSVVLGRCPSGRAILRRGASAGELICVSGRLGGAAAGLRSLLTRSIADIPPAKLKKQLKPTPQVELANHLQSQGFVSAMIDISDGLSSDLGHICDASEVGAVIDADSLPIDPLAAEPFDGSGVERVTGVLDLALNGGEDFELLFTVSPEHEQAVRDLGCSIIGSIVEDPAVYSIVIEGREMPLRRKGYRHFRA